MQNAFSISQLYGSLGLIPLFMFWTYLMWLAILFGLQVSAILQTLHGRRLEEMEPRHEVTGLVEPSAVVTVMQIVAEAFSRGDSLTVDLISDTTGIGRLPVRKILEHLVAVGLLHRLDRGSMAVTLARPAEAIPVARLVEIGFQMVDEGGVAHAPFSDALRDAQRQLAAEQTLAQLPPVIEAPQERLPQDSPDEHDQQTP